MEDLGIAPEGDAVRGGAHMRSLHRSPPPEVAELVAQARRTKRSALLEPEGYDLLRRLGIAVPAHLWVRDSSEAIKADLAVLPGKRAVVKAISPTLLHKSEVGGVAVVAKAPLAVAAAVSSMAARLADRRIEGFTINEYVPHDPSPGGELLVGVRRTAELGPVVTAALGGLHAEPLAASLRPGRAIAVLAPSLHRGRPLRPLLAEKVFMALATCPLGRQAARFDAAVLEELLERLLGFAADLPPELTELEINPLVATPNGPVALDVLVRLAPPERPAYPPRPLAKIGHLLAPRSAAVLGVSGGSNPGRVLLSNLIRAGYAKDRLVVVKPGRDEIDGVRCVPELAALPAPVDLLVVAVGATQVPAVVEDVVANRRAESLLVIPGGLGERAGSGLLERRVRQALARSRSTDWGGPVVNGGNCLGVRSVPGRLDATFIPPEKLPAPSAPPSPLAILAQSGAFAVSRATKLAAAYPRYLVSVGNQSDLTLGDYLRYLADDREVKIFACYVEGFRPGDGLAFLEAARSITASGRTVILYRGGRTAAGTRAAISHTAAVAGDYEITRELARSAGVVVADTLADFDDLVALFDALRGREVAGLRLGAVSNAGFEAVTLADSLGPLRLASFSATTEGKLSKIVDGARLGGVVEVANPLDVTPIVGDEAFAEAVRAVLEDPGVDVGVVGCVPLTGALATLAPADGHGEDVRAEGSVARRLVRLAGEIAKPWVAVVDAGPLYDPMARVLEEGGIPTFRTADRALAIFGAWCTSRLREG